MAEASHKAEHSDRRVEIQSGGEADRHENCKEFSRRDFQHIEHRASLFRSHSSTKHKGPLRRATLKSVGVPGYSVDSISNPQASRRGSGMYFEFLLRRAHSRRRVDRKYWSGESLYSRTTCSNSVMVGVMGPIGSGLPQFGFPRRLAMK